MKNHPDLWAAALLALLVLSCVLSLSLGASGLSPAQVLEAVVQGADSPARRILMYVRLPRLLAAIMAGSSLALSGLLLQQVLHNSLAAPSVIGVNAGAGLFALTAMVVFPHHPQLVSWGAFGGALASAGLVYLLARFTGAGKSAIVLAGVATSSLLGAISDTLITLIPDAAGARSAFSIGGFSSVTMDQLYFALPLMLLGLGITLLLSRERSILSLGDETARSLGLPVEPVRLLLLSAAALLAGSAVSFSGLIGFVGLIAPHAARSLAGKRQEKLLLITLELGALLTVLCDLGARTLFAPYELPVGIMLSFVGAPFFLYLLFQGRRRGRHGAA